ncbi:MAG: DNA methyltransferase [Candidatus Humimicrobiaceae bacterium]
MVSNNNFEHIDYAIVPKSHSSMYSMHKYWARKPHNVVSEYIKHYSKEGEIVLDLFLGSGVTALEAIKIGRKAIGIDLDPMSIFITEQTAIPVDIDELKLGFKKLENETKSIIYKLYETNCNNCGSKRISEAIIINNNLPTEIRFECNCKKEVFKKYWKKTDYYDVEFIKEKEALFSPYWFPQNELVWNSRINVSKGLKVNDLFTNRAIIALSTLYNSIQSLKNPVIRNLLFFCFTSSLAQSSNLVPVYRKIGRERQVGGWDIRGFWIPSEHLEINVWNCFDERFKKLLRGKEETNKLIGLERFKPKKNVLELIKDGTLLLLNQSATNLSNLPNNSVDYIFTDPPYGDAVPYLELNYMWSSWLKMNPAFEEEIIISDSPVRNKKFEEYNQLLIKSFREAFRVLKPEKWMTVTFHSTNLKIYNSIIRAVIFAGFELEKILYQPPARTSAKALLAPYGSAVGDYYIRFIKPKKAKTTGIEKKEFDNINFEQIVIEATKGIIAERGEPVFYNDILKNIYVALDKYGYLLMANPQNISDVLEKYKDKEFVFVEEKGWWFKNPEKYYLHVIPLKDRVETAVLQVLKRKNSVSFDEVLQEIFINFNNALTPNPQNILDVLAEYAYKKNNLWKIKNSIEIRENEHDKIIYILCYLGSKLNFNVYTGHKDAKFEDKKVTGLENYKEINFRSIKPENLKRILEIDAIWYKGDIIQYIFEVENTTGITESINRASNIPYNTYKYIVIPEERENFLNKKINEPMLAEYLKKDIWNLIFYNKLVEFYKEYKNKKVNLNEFVDIINKKGQLIEDIEGGTQLVFS